MDFPQPGVCLLKWTLPLFGYAASEVRPKSLSSKISLKNVHFRMENVIYMLRFSKTHLRRNIDPRASQTHFHEILVLRARQTTFKKKEVLRSPYPCMAHQARKSNVFYSEQAYKKVVFHRVLYGFVDSSPNVFYSKTVIPEKETF